MLTLQMSLSVYGSSLHLFEVLLSSTCKFIVTMVLYLSSICACLYRESKDRAGCLRGGALNNCPLKGAPGQTYSHIGRQQQSQNGSVLPLCSSLLTSHTSEAKVTTQIIQDFNLAISNTSNQKWKVSSQNQTHSSTSGKNCPIHWFRRERVSKWDKWSDAV